jgi:hypothetical protein
MADVSMHYEVIPDSWLLADNFTMVDAREVGGEWSISLRQYSERGEPRAFELTCGAPSLGETAVLESRMSRA